MPYNLKKALPQVLLAIGIIFIMDGVSQRILNRHFMEPWVAFIIVFLISLSGFVSKKESKMTRKIASEASSRTVIGWIIRAIDRV